MWARHFLVPGAMCLCALPSSLPLPPRPGPLPTLAIH